MLLEKELRPDNQDEYEDELEVEEEQLLPREMPVPDWAKEKGPKKLELTDKLIEKIKKGASLSSGTWLIVCAKRELFFKYILKSINKSGRQVYWHGEGAIERD